MRRTYEMTGLRLTAMLPSGRIIDVDSDMQLEIPRISDDEVFVTIGIAKDREYVFEQDGIPFSMPEYSLELHTLEQMSALDVLPLKRFTLDDGVLNVDAQYIMPTLSVGGDTRYNGYIDRYVESMTALIRHQHMADDEGWSCKRNLLHLLFRLKNISGMSATSDLTDLLQEIAHTADFFIVEEMGAGIDAMPEKVTRLHDDPRRILTPYNVAAFMQWLDDYLKALPLVMDQVQLIDHTIDVEALKAEIKRDLTEQMMTALDERLHEMREQLTEELTTRIMETVTEYINGTLKPEMRDELLALLRDPLYQDLYDALLAALSKLFDRPEVVVEDNFMPII